MKKAVVVETVSDSKINLVEIQSLIDAHLLYTGEVSGRQYEWIRAGAIVSVDERDVPVLLVKRYGTKTCCGGNETNQIFQLAK